MHADLIDDILRLAAQSCQPQVIASCLEIPVEDVLHAIRHHHGTTEGEDTLLRSLTAGSALSHALESTLDQIIARRCAEVRSAWSPEERERRRAFRSATPVVLPHYTLTEGAIQHADPV